MFFPYLINEYNNIFDFHNYQLAKQCDGNPRDSNCCSNSNPCGYGEGDCDKDSHCRGFLKCGTNNCKNHFSLSGSNWKSYDDCCMIGNLKFSI